MESEGESDVSILKHNVKCMWLYFPLSSLETTVTIFNLIEYYDYYVYEQKILEKSVKT